MSSLDWLQQLDAISTLFICSLEVAFLVYKKGQNSFFGGLTKKDQIWFHLFRKILFFFHSDSNFMSHQIKSKHYFNLEWQMTTLKTKRWSKPNVLTCRSSLLYNVSVEHSEANSFRDPTSLSLCMSKEHLSLTCFPTLVHTYI